MARTTQQQLDDCDAEIARIESGLQSMRRDERAYARADLEVLYTERGRLERRLGRSKTSTLGRHYR